MKKNNFLKTSIMGALSFVKESLFADEFALKIGFLQGIDPRFKAAVIVAFVVLVMLLKNVFLILSLYIICLILACLSGINMGFFLKRTWIFIPLFSLIIAIPALFSVFSPGKEIFSLNLLGFKLAITQQGIDSALLFLSRVATSVSLMVLFALVTRHNQILKVLRIFGVPQIFVMTFGMCYRYIFLFVGIIQDTYTSIKSRVGFVSSVNKGQKLVAGNIALLWQRSYQMQTQVYNAMLSRGYTGEPKLIEDFSATAKDWIFLLIAATLIILMLWKNQYLN